jgi:pimeloyl-ACP methyl ester carboxylesterase
MSALAHAGEPRLTPVSPTPIDQASWTGRKQHVGLPNGLDLAYVELGDPAAHPVLLLHGYTDTSRVWTMIAPWPAGHRLLIPDQRGHGNSSRPGTGYAPAHFAEDALLFLDELGVQRATIVGSSMGSMVAQLLAAEHPDRVSAIVLAGSTAMAPVDREHWLFGAVTDLDQPANHEPDFLSEWSPSASPTPVDPIFVQHFDREMVEVPPHVWRSVIRELSSFPVGRHAADVHCPALLLSGGKDPLFGPEHHASLIRAYPQAQAIVFPELGHNLVVETPHEIGPIIASFLSQAAVFSVLRTDGSLAPDGDAQRSELDPIRNFAAS